MALFQGVLRSNILGMDTYVNVFLPYDRPTTQQEYPCKVLYLLHGLGNNASSWIRNSKIALYAREEGIAVVMPEVQKSFYADMEYGAPYFTYITEELPQLCKTMFSISANPKDTYIAGFSMGGYGALKCAFTHPENYAGCASLSGVLDMNFVFDTAKEAPVELQNELKGIYGTTLQLKKENDLKFLAQTMMTEHSLDEIPRTYLACGTEDYLYQVNQSFTSYLTQLEMPHIYEEWSGEHNWYFWDDAIKKALHFFSHEI